VRHIHYHHLLGHGAEVMALPERLGLPFDFTAHDFYALCPQISMTDKRNAYCGEEGLVQCIDCLESSPAPGGMGIEAWRARYGSFVIRARHVLVPSRDAARRFLRYLPQADVRLAPHTDVSSTGPLPVPEPRQLLENAPLKIVVIGALSPIKGADVLEDVATEAHKRGAPVEFHLLGYAYRSLRTQPKSALSVYGEYDEAELPALLQWLKPDLVWFPAQWPETYSYTLSACLQAGVPVVAPDLGAFPERLSGRKWSWLQPWAASAGEWLHFFEDIRARHFATGTSPAPYWAVTSNVGAEALISDWDYARDYLTHLDQMPPAPPAPPLTREFMAAHQADRTDLPGQAGLHARRGLLRTLIRLRSAPGLRSIARAVPLRWQTRIKTWLNT
jgi:glycosyltransferase involved in cell wall biosynthesis